MPIWLLMSMDHGERNKFLEGTWREPIDQERDVRNVEQLRKWVADDKDRLQM